MTARKGWIAGQMQLHGKLHLDEGAAGVLREQGRSLLPVGVVRVEGNFAHGDLVALIGPDGIEIGRGLCNYSAADACKIVGAKRTELAARRSEEHTSELQSLMRISYAVFCLKKKKQ